MKVREALGLCGRRNPLVPQYKLLQDGNVIVASCDYVEGIEALALIISEGDCYQEVWIDGSTSRNISYEAFMESRKKDDDFRRGLI